MKRIIILGLSLLISLFSLYTYSAPSQNSGEVAKTLVINNDVVYNPDKLSLDSFQTFEKSFDFDWNDHATISKNQNKVKEIETFFRDNPNDWTQLPAKDREAYGKILYKVATYYLHVDKDPNLAIETINQCQPYLQSKQDKAWAYNQLAYAFERKYSKSRKEADKESAIRYVEKVTKLYNNTKSKELAFAFNVKGLIENDSKNFGYAEFNFLNAMRIYELLGKKDEQYARAKNRLANVILDMDDRDDEALTILKDVKQYWQSRGNVEGNPFAANNMVSLGHAYLKLGKASNARDEIEGAIRIYRNVYGDASPKLCECYLSLSDIYFDLGDKKLAQIYKQKASQMN